jgi:ribonuclease BN (tRNA processing enzyme)
MRRQQPQKKRKRSSSSSSRTIVHTENAPLYLKVLGTSTGDSTPSVIASFSDRKYLFDCGEGLQRFCIEHRVKLKKIGKIFLTSNNVESFGGIPGMMLTIGGVHTSSSSSKEAARLDICGPIGTKRLIHASRKFCHVNPQTCQIRVADVLPSSCGGDICRDRFLNVRAIRLFNESYPKEEYISYLCTTPSSRGKFRPDRARELGVKRGPDFGKLTKGLEVRLESGTIVRPEDVMESSNPGTMFAVVRCPELSWIESLISDKDNELFWNHCRNRKEEMSCIIHMVPTSVLRNEVYSKWAASFGKNTQHIVINQDVCPQNYVHVGTARAVERKSRIAPDVFPYRLFQCSDPVLRLPIREFPQQCMGARNLLKFVLLPRSRRGIKTDEVLSSVTSGSRSGATEGVSKEKASSTITPPKNITELVFLGTRCFLFSLNQLHTHIHSLYKFNRDFIRNSTKISKRKRHSTSIHDKQGDEYDDVKMHVNGYRRRNVRTTRPFVWWCRRCGERDFKSYLCLDFTHAR